MVDEDSLSTDLSVSVKKVVQQFYWLITLFGSLRTADVSPRSSPLRDVSRGETSFLLVKRPTA